MTKAIEELNYEFGGGKEKDHRRESAVIHLSSLMGAPVKPEAVRTARPSPERDEDENPELEIVRKAIELYERDPNRFRELVLEATGGEPVNFQMSAEQRQDRVMNLASMVQEQLSSGR